MTRRKFTSKFKTKVVLEALKERISLLELVRKSELQPTQISAWKREFLESTENVFENGKPDKRSDSEKEKAQLFKPSDNSKWKLIF